VIPSVRLLWLAALPALPLALVAWAPDLVSIGFLLDLVVVAIAIGDLLLTPGPDRLEVSREVPEVLSAGAPHAVRLHVVNRAPEAVALELADEPPVPSDTAELPARLRLAAGEAATVVYHVVPRRRGRSEFAAVHLRFPSRLGFWTRQEKRVLPSPVRIYPDIRAVRRFDLLAGRNRLDEIGLKFWRLHGRGGEFERLREYRRDDERRHIDWKATAKQQRLVSRQYTVERNQNIFFMLDCGRTMANESDGLSHLDRALNAAIILSYIALDQGDNVGLMAFSNRIELVAGPLRGRRGVQGLIQQTFDLHPRIEASDYGMACEELLRRQRKRALVMLITYALDEQHLGWIARYVRSLAAPHVLLLVFLRDVSLARLAATVPHGELEAFHVAAAAEMLNAQARAVRELKDAGALVLETLPSQLSSALINEYLDLKARHLL
jgi:uncharacterized protein (DUF58 family)